jgi:integrase
MGHAGDAAEAVGTLLKILCLAPCLKSSALCRMRHLRRTCARLCHLAGGELDQIQFLLGHVSIQTTEHYLGCKQKLRFAVNDKIGIEP